MSRTHHGGEVGPDQRRQDGHNEPLRQPVAPRPALERGPPPQWRALCDSRLRVCGDDAAALTNEWCCCWATVGASACSSSLFCSFNVADIHYGRAPSSMLYNRNKGVPKRYARRPHLADVGCRAPPRRRSRPAGAAATARASRARRRPRMLPPASASIAE